MKVYVYMLKWISEVGVNNMSNIYYDVHFRQIDCWGNLCPSSLPLTHKTL